MFLFVDGDSQDKERLLGALSAYMLLGMILNSRRRITAPSLVEKDGRLKCLFWSVDSLTCSVLLKNYSIAC